MIWLTGERSGSTVLGYKRPQFCENIKNDHHLSFLWTIKRDPPSYFFGTIHVPYTRVWDYIPDNAKQAFESSDNVYFELDLMDPYTISALANCQMLPQGKNLADIIPNDIYGRLKRHLDYIKGKMPSWMSADQRGRGRYGDYLFNAITGNWERKRPVWVMLMVNSLTENDVKSRGIPVLDLYLAQQAERMKKKTGAVEKVEEQCIPLNGLNISQVLFALNQTLQRHENGRESDVNISQTTDDLIQHYNCGDLNSVIFSQDTTQLPKLTNSSMKSEDKDVARDIDHYFREELIFKRNKRIGDRVIQLLLAHPNETFFFAFGAGHFLGNNTVLDFVQSKGFQIDHVPANKKIRGQKNRDFNMGRMLADWNQASDANIQKINTIDVIDDVRKGHHKRRQNRRLSSSKYLTTTQSPNKQRMFNDLWVRLEAVTTRTTETLTPTPGKENALTIQKALNVWYELKNSSCHLSSSIWITVLLLSTRWKYVLV